MLFIYLIESSQRPSFTSSGQLILTPFPWWLLYAFSFLFTSLVPFPNLSLLAYDLCPYFTDLHSYVLQEPARCSTIRGPCSWEQPLTSSLPCISLSPLTPAIVSPNHQHFLWHDRYTTCCRISALHKHANIYPLTIYRSVCFFLLSLLNTGIQLVKWHIWDLNLQRWTLLLVHFYVPRTRAVLSMWCELRNLFPFLFFFFLFSMRSLFMILWETMQS